VSNHAQGLGGGWARPQPPTMRKPLNPESRDPLKSFVRTSLSRFLLVPVVPKEAGGDECVLPRGVIEVDVERVFDNCPRYIHRLELVEYSRYVPEPDREPPVPDGNSTPPTGTYCRIET